MKKNQTEALEFLLTLIINSITLMLASSIFEGFYVASFGYAIITSIVISILTTIVKPFLKIMLLPITILTTGLFYPFINVIILKLASFIIGDAFVIEGWFIPFFISIFISVVTLVLNNLITNRIVGR